MKYVNPGASLVINMQNAFCEAIVNCASPRPRCDPTKSACCYLGGH